MPNFLFHSQSILFAYKVAHLHSTITSPEGMIFKRRIQLSYSGHKHFLQGNGQPSKTTFIIIRVHYLGTYNELAKLKREKTLLLYFNEILM